MGSSSSKNAASASSSSSSSGVRRTRSMGARVFQSSCLGGSSGSHKTEKGDQVSNNQNKENRSYSHGTTCTDQTRKESDDVKPEYCRKVNDQQQQHPDEVPCISSDVELDEWGQESVTGTVSLADRSSSQAASTRSLFSSSRLRSRFSFIPGNISVRLSRAASLGSSRAYSLFSSGLTISNAEEGFHVHSGSTNNSVNQNEIHQGSELLPVCDVNLLPAPQCEDTSNDVLRLDPVASRLSGSLQNHEIVSTQDVARNNENPRILADVNVNSPRNQPEIESLETRRTNRRIGAREPVERSVRFSRTLSVGRLRDRVLRRSSFSDGLFGRLQEDREVRDSSHDNERQVWDGLTRTPTSDGNEEISPASSSYPPSSLSNSMYNSQDYELETSRPREARFHDIVEHRTDFLQRRRIRSQVRALQRLGSRFENLSGHERSCILSGQHRTGRCTCQTSNQARNPDDDSSARASISRIVMLAEALFDVLDEIHQQSVVLSSRPSVSSIGSVPAPKEVVESMPVKIYMKLQMHQNEDAAQCYICLVEYEEGDCMRILPCHHEFHRTCIDKWLKEIHRVCPLCRGDVCRSEPLPAEN